MDIIQSFYDNMASQYDTIPSCNEDASSFLPGIAGNIMPPSLDILSMFSRWTSLKGVSLGTKTRFLLSLRATSATRLIELDA